MTALLWTEKYRPRRVGEMVGNEEARAAFVRWLRGWSPGMKPVLLIGPPGTGKTTLVHAAAEELGFDVLELNASDYRTKGVLERRLRPAMGGLTVFGSRLVVFLDEVDGLYSRADYGGAEYLLNLMSSITTPLVMAANRDDAGHMPEIEKNSLVILFRRVPARLVELYLRRILEVEGRALRDEVVEKIVRYARGDVRTAVNALQTAVMTGDLEATYRDVQLTLRDAINEAASARAPDVAYSILRSADAQPQDKIRAVYAAITTSGIKNPHRLAKAMRYLSEADMLYSRIIKTQNWKLLRYLDRMLAASLSGTMATYSEYDAPYQVSSRVWNEGRVYKKIAEVMSRNTHTSRKEFMTYYFEALSLSLAKASNSVIKHLSQLIGESVENLKSAVEKEAKRVLEGGGR